MTGEADEGQLSALQWACPPGRRSLWRQPINARMGWSLLAAQGCACAQGRCFNFLLGVGSRRAAADQSTHGMDGGTASAPTCLTLTTACACVCKGRAFLTCTHARDLWQGLCPCAACRDDDKAAWVAAICMAVAGALTVVVVLPLLFWKARRALAQ